MATKASTSAPARSPNDSPTAVSNTSRALALAAKVASVIDGDQDRLETIFKDIHQNPELGFMETRTAAIVARELRALGAFDVKTGIGKTGVVAIFRNGAGPTVMYRADMDANAIEEASGFPYASKVRVKRADGAVVPVAHMCGHDAHVTWMLGLARAMIVLKSEWSGTLVLVGQPAEEPIQGAVAMVEEGLYTTHGVPRPDFFVVLHTAPVATGFLGVRGGAIMAGTDQIDVTFFGVGGHGSTPQFAKDPVVMAAAAIMQYQMIVSRVVNPLEACVLTVGSIHAGTDNNVIPDSALVKINLRFFDLAVREQMIDGIRSINAGIARTYGMPDDKLPSMTMKGHSPPLVNSVELTDRLRVPLQGLLGDDHVVTEFPPATGSEDAHLLVRDVRDVQIALLAVGVADPVLVAGARKEGKSVPFAPHNPGFKVDLAAIPLGAKIGTLAVLELLPRSPKTTGSVAAVSAP